MKKCKKCGIEIPIIEEYCTDCIKNLSLREKVINDLEKANAHWEYCRCGECTK